MEWRRTTTPGLLALSDWLEMHGCTHVALEATGIYWRPVWQVLSVEGRTLILANAGHVKNVPGRKTDVADAVRLSDLLAHGLTRALPAQAARATRQGPRPTHRAPRLLMRHQTRRASFDLGWLCVPV